jgi:transcription antitermination factor NusG
MAAPLPLLSPLSIEAETWAALRCQSVHTLALADGLADHGLAGWSPRIQLRYRLPRKRKTELRTVPLLPSFVFVPFAMTDRALDLALAGKLPRARPFLFNGFRPALPVVQLQAMEASHPAKPGDLFKPGEKVRFVIGPLHGLEGIVLARKGRDRWLVDMNGRRVLVPSFLIAPVTVKA